jgi:murein DD-endopeptidase MepM/ murein hydrolase activator NlpD
MLGPAGAAAINLPTPPPATFRDIPGLAALLHRLRTPAGSAPDIQHLVLPGQDPATARAAPGQTDDGVSAGTLAAFPAPSSPSSPATEPAAPGRAPWVLPLVGGLTLLALLPVRLPRRLRRNARSAVSLPSRAAVLLMLVVTAVVVDAPDASSPAPPTAPGRTAITVAVPPGALLAHLAGALPVARVVAAPPVPVPVITAKPTAPVAAQLVEVERAIQADATAVAGFARALSAGDDARPNGTSLAEAYARAGTAYRADLDRERAVYDHAAHDPSVAATLAAWATTNSADAAALVARNLEAVTSSVRAIEQRATDASTLAALGAIAPAQQAAIESGSPFMVPLPGGITQPYGPTSLGIEPTVTVVGVVYAHFHTGLDIGAPFDSPVRASADGVVIFAGPQTDAAGALVGYGNHVVIAHPQGFTSTYAHLDQITVTAGQVIAQGEAVGLEGSTGNSTGPHLHFEIRHDGVPLDPAAYLPGQLP